MISIQIYDCINILINSVSLLMMTQYFFKPVIMSFHEKVFNTHQMSPNIVFLTWVVWFSAQESLVLIHDSGIQVCNKILASSNSSN